MRIERYKRGRHWAVYDGAGRLVVVALYKRGAEEVRRRLCPTEDGGAAANASPPPRQATASGGRDAAGASQAPEPTRHRDAPGEIGKDR